MHADPAKVVGKTRLHVFSDRWIERTARGFHHLFSGMWNTDGNLV
jgi:hypothetical protein